jgi:hypothetical protein
VLTIVRRTKERAPHPLVGILSEGGHPLGQGANGGVGLGWVLLRPNLWSAQQEVTNGILPEQAPFGRRSRRVERYLGGVRNIGMPLPHLGIRRSRSEVASTYGSASPAEVVHHR